MAGVGAIVKVLTASLAATFGVVLSLTVGLGLGPDQGVERTVALALLLATPFLLSDGKLTSPTTRSGQLRSSFLVRHHVLMIAPPSEVRGWARAALEGSHAHAVESTDTHIGGWIGPVDIVGVLLPFVPSARQYQLVIFNDTSCDDAMSEVTICARPRRLSVRRREQTARHCYQLVHDVEAMIGEQRLVLLEQVVARFEDTHHIAA